MIRLNINQIIISNYVSLTNCVGDEFSCKTPHMPIQAALCTDEKSQYYMRASLFFGWSDTIALRRHRRRRRHRHISQVHTSIYPPKCISLAFTHQHYAACAHTHTAIEKNRSSRMCACVRACKLFVQIAVRVANSHT